MICEYCDEDSDTCNKDYLDCIRDREESDAEDRFEAKRDARD
jgi:hypothetical protein